MWNISIGTNSRRNASHRAHCAKRNTEKQALIISAIDFVGIILVIFVIVVDVSEQLFCGCEQVFLAFAWPVFSLFNISAFFFETFVNFINLLALFIRFNACLTLCFVNGSHTLIELT